MRPNLMRIALPLAGLCVLPALADEQAHWAYQGKLGPAHWGEVAATCQIGQQQSPVNINTRRAKKGTLPALDVHWSKATGEVVNNGHTIQVNLPPGSYLDLGGTRYELAQFHFHTPSEHQLDGKAWPLEAHFVHKTAEGKLAVVGLLVKTGAENVALKPLFANLPASEDAKNQLEVDPAALLPKKLEYFTYEGSLTTPPCSEGVHWMVLERPITASDAQIRAFRKLFHHNARPIQPLHARAVELEGS
jgi:carbonic anhydrase